MKVVIGSRISMLAKLSYLARKLLEKRDILMRTILARILASIALLALPLTAFSEPDEAEVAEALDYFQQPFTRLDAAILNIERVAKRDMHFLVDDQIGSGSPIHVEASYELSPFEIWLIVIVDDVEIYLLNESRCRKLADEINDWFSDGIYWMGIGPGVTNKQFRMGTVLSNYMRTEVRLRSSGSISGKEMIECQTGRDLFLPQPD